MKFNEFLEILKLKSGKDLKKTSHGYITCCPAHDDENPSLSICEAVDGKILLKCFSGCTIVDICTSLNIQVSELFGKLKSERQETNRVIYSYKDEDGHELYRKIRIEPGFNGKTKDFYCEHNDNGRVVKNLKGCRKVLYHLPEVLEAISNRKPIFLVEGEKDADKLNGLGLAATTALESLKWQDQYTEILKNADVVILYDMDKTGFERRDLLCKHLYGKVKRLRVVELPGLEYQESHGHDISDWLARGNTINHFHEILSKTADYHFENKKAKLRTVTLEEFLTMDLPKQEMILAPFLPSQGLCLLYAKRGVGKTHVAIGIAYAVAVGGSFLKWKAANPRKVLYIDGEMPAVAMQERLKRISLSEILNLRLPITFA